VKPPQLNDLNFFAEIQADPALPEDKSVWVFRDFTQCFYVADALGLIDGTGELMIL
jgi:hypothetical protein